MTIKSKKKRIEELETELERKNKTHYRERILHGEELSTVLGQVDFFQKRADAYKAEVLKWKEKYLEQLELNLALAERLKGADNEQREAD